MGRKAGLAPVLPRGRIRLLILGSLPSDASIARGEYYGHPGNHFWRVLERCGVIAEAAASYRSRVAELRRRGMALWDLYASAEREGSGDDRIERAEANDVGGLWRERGPFAVALNGRRGREWRRSFGELPVEPVELPSTSPRPLHWNTAASRREAVGEWCAALGVVGH